MNNFVDTKDFYVLSRNKMNNFVDTSKEKLSY